jgi:hypothetical protein
MDHSPAAYPLPPPWPDILAVRPMPAIPPQARSMFLWGDMRVQWVALRTAAGAVAKGLGVALLDAATAFQVMPLVAMAHACRVPPEAFLQRVSIARAFTCWQLTTLFCERLAPLLAAQPMGLVVLLDPLTHVFDEDVTDNEARILFRRVLDTLAQVSSAGLRVLVTQTVPAFLTPRRVFARDLLHLSMQACGSCRVKAAGRSTS